MDNDQMALGATAALREYGLRIPDDVSVVGFDDVLEACFYTLPLSHRAPGWAGRASQPHQRAGEVG